MYYQDSLLLSQGGIVQRQKSIIDKQQQLLDSCDYISNRALRVSDGLSKQIIHERNQKHIWQGITVLTLILTLIL